MHDESSLFLLPELSIKERQGRRSGRTLDRHRKQPGRFVKDDKRIVLVKHGKLAGKTQPAPVLVRRDSIGSSSTIAALGGRFFIEQAPVDQSISNPFPQTSAFA